MVVREGKGSKGGQGQQGRARVAREGEGSDSGNVSVSSEVSMEWIGEDGSLAPACAVSWEQSRLCPSQLKRAASMTMAWLGWLLPLARLMALAKI